MNKTTKKKLIAKVNKNELTSWNIATVSEDMLLNAFKKHLFLLKVEELIKVVLNEKGTVYKVSKEQKSKRG